MTQSPRLIEVRAKVLKQNDLLARSLRDRFREAGVYVASFVSSPGSGKTKFLEELLKLVGQEFSVAALVGDLATENDAMRLKRAASKVKQIVTGTVCHLDASMVDVALAQWDLAEIDLLCIENVGNLVCPSSYDLGENLRFVLLSTTEGEDKPLKYPTIFNTADVAVITKMDVAEAAEFDCAAAYRNIESVRPGMKIMQVSAKTGVGMSEVAALLRENVAAAKSEALSYAAGV